jgi:Lon protease-like protein
MQTKSTIPLFPLGVVLMPHLRLPLHIFEERYKIMIGECLEHNKEFGVVYFDSREIKKVGCTAQIVEVLKEYDTGEMDIITVGRRRFMLTEIYEEKPYLEAGVVYFDDSPEEEDEALIELARQGMESLKALDRMTGNEIDYAPMERLDLKRISFLISGIDGFKLSEKQRLLEMTSTRKRLESGVQSLQKVLERAKISKEIEKIIGGNGNIKKMLNQDDTG